MKTKWFGGFALLVIVLYGWAAGGAYRGLATKEPQDYYGYLTDAFLAGQTYLKVAPDPALQNLANPWAGAQGVSRLHDATYFHGRYYIYFGPAPVLLLLLPWRVITGTFLAQAVATAIFAIAGTLIAGAILLWAWRRWFSDLRPIWLALGFLLIAFSSRALVLAEDASVYQVPITSAFFCLMAAIGLASWAMTESGGRKRALGLGLASLAWGLAVASRPDYVFSLVGLTLPPIYLAMRDRRAGKAGAASFFRLAACAFLPAAIVGMGLAAYNYHRFGDMGEFGVRYQFTAGDQRFIALVTPGGLVGTLKRYFLARPPYSIYFPFLVSVENRGLVFCTTFAVLAAAFPLTLCFRSWRGRADWTAWGLMLTLALVPNILSLGILAIANERYFLDFTPLAVLLGVVSAWAILISLRRTSRLLHDVGQAAILVLALWTIGQGALMALESYPNASALRPLARWADRAVAAMEKWRGTAYGPLILRVRFPDRAGGDPEPLLVSGHGNDIVYAEYPARGQIRIGFFHTGSGGPVSDPIAIVPGKNYALRLDLGSLYPPRDHPLLAAWPDPLTDVLLHRLDIKLDGRTVLQANAAFYPTYPGDIHLGQNPGTIFAAGRFTGELTVAGREAIPSVASLRGPPGEGPVRLVVRFPSFQGFHREPLISTGHRLAGDLLYVAYVAPGLIRLGHDSWGGGGLETAPLPYDPRQDQVIEADLASLRPMAGSHETGTFALRFNGRLVMATPQFFNASPPAEVFFGFNGCDASTASATFTGEIVRAERVGPLAAPRPLGETAGPVQLLLRFPENRTGAAEPLLGLGRSAAGELVDIHYLNDHQVAIGYVRSDGTGHLGQPIAVDYAATHAIEISLGSLYPSVGSGAWGGVPETRRLQALETLEVKLDGQTALLAHEPAQPGENREIGAGKNSPGVAACGPAFTGQLFVQQRLAPGDALPPDIQDGLGPVQLSLHFPTGRSGQSEPLLVTGRAGAGDAVYVRYIDGHHLSLGYDHWNAGGPLSAPIAVDYGSAHLVEISLGSLYPEPGDPAWGPVPEKEQSRLHGTIAVVLDGRPVIQASQTAYAAAPREIDACANKIGASSCGPAFTGEIDRERRLAPGAGAAGRPAALSAGSPAARPSP